MARDRLQRSVLACRGTMLPALYFEPVVLPATTARSRAAELAVTAGTIALVVFPDGDDGDDEAEARVGTALNAWPNGARRRSLPLLPALRLTGTAGRAREELEAAAAPLLRTGGFVRRFAYDAVVVDAGGAISAVFWTIRSPDQAGGGSSGRPRSWLRPPRACLARRREHR